MQIKKHKHLMVGELYIRTNDSSLVYRLRSLEMIAYPAQENEDVRATFELAFCFDLDPLSDHGTTTVRLDLWTRINLVDLASIRLRLDTFLNRELEKLESSIACEDQS